MPGEFIKVAEESGLIVPIGEWVQHDRRCQWAAWVAAGLDPGVLSVNVSGVEFAAAEFRKPRARRWRHRDCRRSSSNWKSPKVRS
jgi:EAL domain-containing protein (putative c-di-GMP-specific phosphodiesterase class I)